MREIENHQENTMARSINDANLVGKIRETEYLYSFRVSPQNAYIISKRKTVTLQWRNLTKWSQLTSQVVSCIDNMCPLIWYVEKNSSRLLSLSLMHNINVIMRTTTTTNKFKLRESQKVSSTWKIRKDWRTVRLEKTKETG